MKQIVTFILSFAIMSACIAQSQKKASAWDKSYDINLLKLRSAIAPKFKTLKFKDAVTSKTMTYNLFIPQNYDKKKSYPLV